MCCFGHGFRSSLLGMIRRPNSLNSPQSLWYQGTTVLRAKKHLYTCASVQTHVHTRRTCTHRQEQELLPGVSLAPTEVFKHI